MYRFRMNRDVRAKSLQQKCMDNLGLVMRHLFISKTFIELQACDMPHSFA